MANARASAATDRTAIGRCLLDLDRLTAERIRALLSRAAIHAAAPDARHETLRGRVVANLFFEDSTRTRVSFTIAARRLGADVVDLSSKGSSVAKGETIADTARTVEAMGAHAIVVRHHASGSAKIIADAVQCVVMNAGDGRHAHPTQGLLDTLTIASEFDRVDGFDLRGLRVGVVGDLAHSRVARSDIGALTKLGAEVVCVGPPQLAPSSLTTLGCEVSHDLDEVIPTLDAVQMLRVQFERGASVGSVREYAARYQLNDARASRMKRGAVVLHPGPMNRGVEISPDVANGARSRIFLQVKMGVAVRMAGLELTMGQVGASDVAAWAGAEACPAAS